MSWEDTGVLELDERRRHLCRLTPDRALESSEETYDFLCDRGLFTRSPDSALPSFFGACHEEPYAPGSSGFGSWPATKYPWYFEVAERPDVHELRIHHGKSILLTDATQALVDPICRAELARMDTTAEDWARLLTHLADAGPSTLEDLQTELQLKPKELKNMRVPLERCGAVVSRTLRVELADGGHRHTSELLRYDQAYPDPIEGGGLDELVVAAIRAAVVAPEREVVRRWFSWRWLFPDDLVDRLVSEGRLERPEPGWVAASTSS